MRERKWNWWGEKNHPGSREELLLSFFVLVSKSSAREEDMGRIDWSNAKCRYPAGKIMSSDIKC